MMGCTQSDQPMDASGTTAIPTFADKWTANSFSTRNGHGINSVMSPVYLLFKC